MAKATEIRRKYNKSDDLMLEQAQIFHDLLTLDLADFSAEFTSFTAGFVTGFQSAIDAALAIPLSEFELGQLESYTEDVENAMEACRVQYQRLLRYVRIIYPNSPGKVAVFDPDGYEAIRKSQTRMYPFMTNAYSFANAAPYKALLIAEGFVQTEIDKLETLAEALYDANKTQELYRKELLSKTEERVEALNEVWEIMVKISNASKQVYEESYAKQQQYLLYPESSGGKLPSKVQNLSFDLLQTKLKWDVAANSDQYELEEKMSGSAFSWNTIYTGEANEYLHAVPPGEWEYRCRGKNSEGSGEWSDVLEVDSPS